MDWDSQPSWDSHLPPHPKTHPQPTAVPWLGCTSRCHSGSFWQHIHPSSFHPSCLCLSPQLPLRMAGTGQILPALSLALHKPSLAPPHQHCSHCSQAGSFPNRGSSFWQKLPASDPDFIPGFLTAGCDPGWWDSPSALHNNCLPFRNCTRGLKLSVLEALSLGLFIESGFPKASCFWGPQSYAKNTSFLLKAKI